MKVVIMYSNEPPSPEHVVRLEALREDISVIVADSEPNAIQQVDAEVILGHRYLRQTLPHTHSLRWVQSTAAGVDHLLTREFMRVGPILTRCPIFSHIVARHAFALALAVLRRVPEAARAQHRGEWARSSLKMLPLPQTAMVVGVGCIGSELAKLLRQNGLTVLGVIKRPSRGAEALCDELLDTGSWRQRLAEVDLCFITLPLTSETKRLFEKDTLQQLPKHAVLVNVGRGEIVDTPVLCQLLRQGKLGGAALDVLAPVPESRDDPLWTTPNLLLTPKVAVFHPGRQKELEDFVESQLSRYLSGKQLLHVVDVQKLTQRPGADQ